MKILKIILLILVILFSTFSIYSYIVINSSAPVHYVNAMPGKMLGATVPPFGIFVDKKYVNEGSAPCSILAHEHIHWLQYQERGLYSFYATYLSGWLQHGRLYNDLERDARARSTPPQGCPKTQRSK